MNTDHRYLIKALRAFRTTVYGQFDQASEYTVPETQDAADAIEALLRENKSLKQALRTVADMSDRPLCPNDYPRPGDKPNQHGGRWAYRHEEMGAIAKGTLTEVGSKEATP